MNFKKVLKYAFVGLLIPPLIFLTIFIFSFLEEFICVGFFGYASSEDAFPTVLKFKQDEVLAILSDKYNEGKLNDIEDIKKTINSLICERSGRYDYKFIDNNLTVSYNLPLWHIPFRKKSKCTYNIDYYVNPNGKIIVYSNDIRNLEKPNKNVLVTYIEKTIEDKNWDRTKDFHRGEYMTPEELKALIKRFSEEDKIPDNLKANDTENKK